MRPDSYFNSTHQKHVWDLASYPRAEMWNGHYFIRFLNSLFCSFSSDQFRGGDPVWAGHSRRPGCGLDSRKHLLGGKQPGPDRGGQIGWNHEDHPAGWGSGAPTGHRPRPSRWVRKPEASFLNYRTYYHPPDGLTAFCCPVAVFSSGQTGMLVYPGLRRRP